VDELKEGGLEPAVPARSLEFGLLWPIEANESLGLAGAAQEGTNFHLFDLFDFSQSSLFTMFERIKHLYGEMRNVPFFGRGAVAHSPWALASVLGCFLINRFPLKKLRAGLFQTIIVV
jgi:hypothetical protein